MNEPKGMYKMRFIGKPNGVFMKGAPGNYEQGKVYDQPWGNGNYKYWERLEETPVMVAPELTDADNAFDDEMFVPEEETVVTPQPKLEIMIEDIPEVVEVEKAVEEISVEPATPMVHDEDVNISPYTMATIEPYMSFNTGTGELSDYEEPMPVEETVSSVEEPALPTENLDRLELLNALEVAKVEVKKGTRTTTLKKMVDDLEP